MSQVRPVFPGLDSMRAIASIAVVVTHVCFWSGFYGHGTLGIATHRLEVGVPIFFVLSGFLLFYPHVERYRTQAPTDGVRRYAVKRVARVLPVYLVAVVLAMTVLERNHDLGWDRWLTNVVMVDYYLHDNLPLGLAQMWSLYVEVVFYAALPLLAWLLGRSQRRGWRPARLVLALTALAALSLVWTAAGLSNRAMPAYLIWFAGGMLMAVASVHVRHGGDGSRVLDVVRVLAARPSTCWLLAASVFVLASTPLTGPASLDLRSDAEAVARLVLYALVAVLVVLPSALGERHGPYAETMAHPLLRHLGRTSYSLFCVHVVVLEWLPPRLGFTLFDANPFTLLVVVLGASLLLAEVVYRVVEKPAMRWAHRGTRTVRDAQAPSATTASS